jgi:MFS family permease
VLLPLAIAVAAALLFWLRERRAREPLMSFELLRRHRNYLGATVSQGLAVMVEMGVGVIFPLILILNLEMDPALAGLALIPTTVPMVVGAPLAGRWYDRAGGRPPLVAGFSLLAVSGVLMAIGADHHSYVAILPGLLVYGVGLSLVLTVNDPVSVDEIPQADQGQASGVSATAEQFGGALGIAILYSIFHGSYIDRLHANVEASPLSNLTDAQYAQLRHTLESAEATGLHLQAIDPFMRGYVLIARGAAQHGYVMTFVAVAVIAAVGAALVAWLVRKPPALAG